MKKYLLVFILLISSYHTFGQDKLFSDEKKIVPKKGLLICGDGDFDIPAADMAKRFGLSYRIGFGFMYKTSSNWLFGAKCDFILGNLIKEDSLMINIRDKYDKNFNGKLVEFINAAGQRIGVPVFERGYAIGIQVGKIIPLSKYKPDNGLLFITTVGFMQHKIDIYDKDKTVPQIRGDYLKGYDRLTNGSFVEQYAGYVFFSKNKLINFNLGFDLLCGFTQGRRDFLYDVMRTDNSNRLDILYGLKGTWIIPVFKRKSEDILFE